MDKILKSDKNQNLEMPFGISLLCLASLASTQKIRLPIILFDGLDDRKSIFLCRSPISRGSDRDADNTLQMWHVCLILTKLPLFEHKYLNHPCGRIPLPPSSIPQRMSQAVCL
jgi:hypothetical protein